MAILELRASSRRAICSENVPAQKMSLLLLLTDILDSTDILDFGARVLRHFWLAARRLRERATDRGHGSARLLVRPRAIRSCRGRREAHECARPWPERRLVAEGHAAVSSGHILQDADRLANSIGGAAAYAAGW